MRFLCLSYLTRLVTIGVDMSSTIPPALFFLTSDFCCLSSASRLVGAVSTEDAKIPSNI